MGRGVRQAQRSALRIGYILAAVVTTRTKGHPVFLGEVILVFGVPAVIAANLQRVLSYDLRKVILVRIKILSVVPRRKAPNSRKPSAIDPHRGIAGRVPREKRRD